MQRSKKVNILEVNGAQYKGNKCIANKISDTLAELSFQQNYDFIFLELKQKDKLLYMWTNAKSFCSTGTAIIAL